MTLPISPWVLLLAKYITDIEFRPHFFLKLAKWKIFRGSWKSGKFSDLSEIFPQLQIFQLIKFWKNIFRSFQIGKFSTFSKCSNSSEFSGKISNFSNRSENWIFEKIWKVEKFPLSANVPIHLNLLEKFPTSPISLKIGFSKKNWKVENFPIHWKNFLYCKYSNSSNFWRN